MISSLSFATFAVSPDKAELRLRLSFTLILTSVTFKYVITQSLPKISYLTYMDKYVLMSLGILCIISIWHAVVTLFDPDHIALRTGQFGSSSEPLASESPHTFMQTDENTTHWWMDESNASMLINSAISKFWLGSSPGGLKSDFFQSDSDTDGNGDAESGDQKVNHTTVIENVSEECSLNNKMACEEWRHVQTVEQHVFVSFVIIYVIAHAVFIFWLYFDASRRRREMRQKDKEYRKQKRKAGV
ncbi:unnamed protein product [Dicrocoelium dendriticum]|nr:unnamed protein product [Dicrocoelium dendriticum]